MKSWSMRILLGWCLIGLAGLSNAHEAAAITWQQVEGRIAGDEPIFPSEQKQDGLEGWVQTSFIVNEQGDVEDAIVVLSSGNKALEDAALKAVNSWQFAASGYSKIMPRVQINFRQSADGRDGIFENDVEQGKVNHRFLSGFKRGMSSITDGDFVAAQSKWQDLKNRINNNWTENSYLWVLDAYFHDAQQAYPQVLLATERVLVNGREFLPKNLFVEVLKKRFVAAIQSNQLQIAADSFVLLKSSTDDKNTIASLQPYYQQAKTLLASKEPTESIGLVPEHGNWHQPVTGSQVTVTAYEGKLDNVKVRCSDWHTNSDVQKQSDGNMSANITIDKNAQNCQLFVFGDKNAVALVSEI